MFCLCVMPNIPAQAKIKIFFVSPYPTDPIKIARSKNLFFFFTKIYTSPLEDFSVLFCYISI